jgi:hypothetical protein
MLLGDLLASFDDETVASEAILRLGDLSLLASVRARAEAEGETLGAYAVSAVRHFAAEASDETWISLMGALARAEDPGAVCLKQALAHSLPATTSSTNDRLYQRMSFPHR